VKTEKHRNADMGDDWSKTVAVSKEASYGVIMWEPTIF
jgi:hypothetical protein